SLETATQIGTTAFWKCAEVGDIDGMRLLVTYGADPNIPSRDGVTPLLMASGAGTHGNDDVMAPPGRFAAVRYLVEELHADVNAQPSPPPAPAAAPAPGAPAPPKKPRAGGRGARVRQERAGAALGANPAPAAGAPTPQPAQPQQPPQQQQQQQQQGGRNRD